MQLKKPLTLTFIFTYLSINIDRPQHAASHLPGNSASIQLQSISLIYALHSITAPHSTWLPPYYPPKTKVPRPAHIEKHISRDHPRYAV